MTIGYVLFCETGFKTATVCQNNTAAVQLKVDTQTMSAGNQLPTLDPVDVAGIFAFGFTAVLLCFLVGRGIGSVLSLLRGS